MHVPHRFSCIGCAAPPLTRALGRPLATPAKPLRLALAALSPAAPQSRRRAPYDPRVPHVPLASPQGTLGVGATTMM